MRASPEILIEPRAGGGHAAALVVAGRLEDLLIDPDGADAAPRPEGIHRSVVGRPMKGLGGAIVELGCGARGFLRMARPPRAGTRMLVQVSTWAEPGKAAPVTPRLALRGRASVLTPGKPGRNIARSVLDPELRAHCAALVDAAMAGADPDLGLILRTAAACLPDEEIRAEIAALRGEWDAIAVDGLGGPPGCLRAGPGAATIAHRDWTGAPGAEVIEAPDAFARHEIWQAVAALRAPRVTLGDASMFIEPTRALVAVDVNTGGDLTPAAGLKANLACARDLPRQLRLRGLGGQVTIDFAPLARVERKTIEVALTRALKEDGIDTSLVGWTPLGHLELNRKRARRPLSETAQVTVPRR